LKQCLSFVIITFYKKPIKEIERNIIEESDETELEHGVTFNLSLSNAERMEREKVILPHLDRRTESKIEIESEDEDDPDDDIDI